MVDKLTTLCEEIVFFAAQRVYEPEVRENGNVCFLTVADISPCDLTFVHVISLHVHMCRTSWARLSVLWVKLWAPWEAAWKNL